MTRIPIITQTATPQKAAIKLLPIRPGNRNRSQARSAGPET